MSAKIQKKYSVNATGELHINDDGAITITNVDTGEVFDVSVGRLVKIRCIFFKKLIILLCCPILYINHSFRVVIC